MIRRPESWRDGQALDAYARFDGCALLVAPERDAVIPDDVTELLRTVPATDVDWPIGSITFRMQATTLRGEG
ncbi:hypothetical protein ACFWOJ_11630 [Streptomyces sp. NPDC058439]|uniref:hypothetical protein n=1 Tax=Streptomyces sp. NPDC058439 TaxID=3346500 RepID=UPI003650888C